MMFSYLILIVALAVAAYLFITALGGGGSAATIARFLRWLLIIGGAFLALVFLLSGRWGLVILALTLFLLGVLAGGFGAGAPTAAGGGRRSRRGPGSSSVKTPYLDLTLDHGSGTVSGWILQGQFAGQRIEDLAVSDLLELLRECRDDEQSAQLLAAYLDREYPDWRNMAGASEAGAGFRGPMTQEEAYELLGLQPGADDKEIRKAYRAKMAEHHPDRGGDPAMAARLNEARDLLLGG
jgi:hypothetical protein